GVAGAGMPWAIAELSVANLRQPEASPLASRRQTRLALAAKLISQRDLLPFGVAEDVRAKLAGVAVVDAKDLAPRGHGLAEQVVSRAWHRISRHFSHEKIDNLLSQGRRDASVGFPPVAKLSDSHCII